jgi:hypothetical protein
MRMAKILARAAVAMVLALAGQQAPAAGPGCLPVLRTGARVTGNQDVLARLLAAGDACPPDVLALRQRIVGSGGVLATAFIGNRGFHNPGRGSFSLFETVGGTLDGLGKVEEGEMFFGHFTVADGARLSLDQDPTPPSLMVEAIAWDAAKGLFNFYELRGNGKTGTWTYNGDSADIVADIERLHRARAPGQEAFGERLRCSGCHVNGGPILKELAPPHNDWWTPARPLPLGGRQFDPVLSRIAQGFVGPDPLAAGVRAGVARLQASSRYRALLRARSLQERLRPLFCPVELNLASDGAPLDETSAVTLLPSSLLVDPRLAEGVLKVSRVDYEAALRSVGSRFPETPRRDADHAWLGPVKAHSDEIAIQVLIEDGLVDAEFVGDVLAVDFTNPALSDSRCRLLSLVPAAAAADWPARFRGALQASERPEAKALLANLTDPDRDAESHRLRAEALLAACARNLGSADFVRSALRLVGQRRAAVAANEISHNRQGKILEPGFRIVFPVQAAAEGARALRLSETCEVLDD